MKIKFRNKTQFFKPNKFLVIKSIVILIAIIMIIAIIFIHANAQKAITTTKLPSDVIKALMTKLTDLCEDQSEWRYCYGKEFGVINKSLQFPQTLQVLRELQSIDSKTGDCHLIAHYISTSEVEKDPQKWLDIFNYVDQTTCNNAYVHGTLEGRSRFDSSLVLDENTIPEICTQIERRTSKRVGNARITADDACAHIIGHILLSEQGGIIDEAVKTCGKLTENYRKSCMDGIFMENITRDNLEVHEVAKKFALTKVAAESIEKMCKTQTGDAERSCWRELSHIYTPITSNNPEEVFTLCNQSPNMEYGKECYMHAINLMILTENFTLGKLAKLCTPYTTDEDRKNCISRSLTPLLGSSTNFTDRAISFCETQPETTKEFCYSKIGQIIKPKSNYQKRQESCEKVPVKYSKYCIGEK